MKFTCSFSDSSVSWVISQSDIPTNLPTVDKLPLGKRRNLLLALKGVVSVVLSRVFTMGSICPDLSDNDCLLGPFYNFTRHGLF